MNKYVVLLIIIIVIGIVLIVYFSATSTLKKYRERMDLAENNIESALDKKLDIIIGMNNEIKKVTGKKDYLKDYVDLNKLLITNIEKDIKLTEAERLINELLKDYSDLLNDSKMKKMIVNLREVNESLTSSKNMYNKNAFESNNELKSFPTNVVGKISKYNFKSYYNNKTDDEVF